MARKHGSGSVFTIADSGGVDRDLSSYISAVDGLPGEVDVVETTGQGGQGSKQKLAGLKDAKIALKFFFDDTATSGIDVVLGGILGLTKAWTYGPAGNGSGARKHSGNGILQSYKLSSPVNGAVTGSADIEVTGGVTIGTW